MFPLVPMWQHLWIQLYMPPFMWNRLPFTPLCLHPSFVCINHKNNHPICFRLIVFEMHLQISLCPKSICTCSVYCTPSVHFCSMKKESSHCTNEKSVPAVVSKGNCAIQVQKFSEKVEGRGQEFLMWANILTNIFARRGPMRCVPGNLGEYYGQQGGGALASVGKKQPDVETGLPSHPAVYQEQLLSLSSPARVYPVSHPFREITNTLASPYSSVNKTVTNVYYLV